MNVTIGVAGASNSWENSFPEQVRCPKCGRDSDLAFVADEGLSEQGENGLKVCDLHQSTEREGGLWLREDCAVAIYFCRGCLNVSAKWNQAYS